MLTAVTEIVCAHSPDSDDAYMFYALATRKVRSPLLTFRHVLEDIQTLNQKAREGEYELSAISYHAYPYVADKYVLMAAGSSVGDGYGPMVVAPHPMTPAELKGKRIAIPGLLTTAYLTLRLMQPDFEAVVVPFDRILEAIQNGNRRRRPGDSRSPAHLWPRRIPQRGRSGPLVERHLRSAPAAGRERPAARSAPGSRPRSCRLMRESIQYALDHREEALNYAMQFARDMEPSLAEKFVGMYVNHYTVDCGELVPKAAQKLLDMGYEAGLIPHRVVLEFVR